MTAKQVVRTLATTMSALLISLARALGLPLRAWSAPGNANPPINALPAELFIDILLETLEFEWRLAPQLHTLARVCTYWLHSILSDARFWRVIELYDMHLIPMVVKRNPSGPLGIRCRGGPDVPIAKFLEAARAHAHRCDSLELVGELTERDLQLLNIPTPALVTLDIENYHRESTPFPLSPAITVLKQVHVSSIRLPWDSPSLAGLKSISIEGIHSGGPSLRQIVTILTASPALEFFTLRNVIEPPTSADDIEVPKETISLPALRRLILRPSHTPSITRHLLETIDTPNCHVLEADIPYEFIQHPGPTFVKLISIPMTVANCVYVYYFGTHIMVSIYSPLLWDEDFRGGWRYGGSSRARIDLSIGGVPYPSNASEQLVNVLGLHPDQIEVHLKLYGRAGAVDSASLFGNRPAIWDSTTRLHLYGLESTISDLRFLADPVIDNGVAWWPCPRLTHIELRGAADMAGKDVADAVLEFLEKRSVDRYPWKRDVNVAWDMPVQLEYIEADETIIMFLHGTKYVEEVELKARRRLA